MGDSSCRLPVEDSLMPFFRLLFVIQFWLWGIPSKLLA